MTSNEPAPRSGRSAIPLRLSSRLQVAPVREAAAALCREGTPGERLAAALAEAEARASEACARERCATCERLWGASGLTCEQRRARRLVKRAVMALLPLMDRRCTLEQAWSALARAIDGAADCTQTNCSSQAG